jgi:hypothetical protein
MKALAAASIGQYEQSVRALGDDYRTAELGLSLCFRGVGSATALTGEIRPTEAGAMGVVVFGSDQGVVGQFGHVVADDALKTLATLPGWASLANRKPARGCGWRHRYPAGTHPRISCAGRVRRITREREREPPGGDDNHLFITAAILTF